MPWQPYTFPNKKAIESETNTTFYVTLKGLLESVDDFEIAPAPGSEATFSEGKLRKLKEELWALHLQECTRNEFRRLLDDAFEGDCQMAAFKLTDITGRRVSNRTVQAWLIESGKKSSRTCPEWAVKALKEHLNNPEFREELALRHKYARRDSTEGYSQLTEVEKKYGVRIATNQIDADEHRAEEWKLAGFNTLPRMLHTLERDTQGYLAFLHDTVTAFITAMENSSNYEEFRAKGEVALRDIRLRDASLKQTRRAIENRTDEFASDEGLPS